MGFEPQLRSIMGQVRPDRQTLMFSATFRRRIESLALDVLTNAVKLTIGQVGQANEDIRQIVVVLPGHGAKWPWLMARMRSLVDEGRLLIFAGSKAGCEQLAKNLAVAFPAAPALCLHGDKTQQERAQALAKFKHGECRVLVATDVAARGLDIKDVKNVVNFDVAKNIDTHVHRIGRTGRMGLEGFEPGTAYTLVTRNEAQFASQLVYNMDVSGQPVSSELLALAKRDARFCRGKAAAGSVNGAESTISNQQHKRSHNGDKDGATDAEDAAELERWNNSRRKSKSDQRKGLGFADARSVKAAGKPAGMREFVKASTSATSLATAFRSGFVKSTLRTDTLKQPLPPNVSVVSARAPVSVSSAPTGQLNPIVGPPPRQSTQQSTQLAENVLSSNHIPPVPPAMIDEDTKAPNIVVAPAPVMQHEVAQCRSPDSSQRVSGLRSESRGRGSHRSPFRSSCSRSRSRSNSRYCRRSRSSSPKTYRRRRRRPSYDRRRRRSNSSDQIRSCSRSRSQSRSWSWSRSRSRSRSRSQRQSLSLTIQRLRGAERHR